MPYISKVHQITYNSGSSGATFGPGVSQPTPTLTVLAGNQIIVSIFWEDSTSSLDLAPRNNFPSGATYTMLGPKRSVATSGGRSIYSTVWLGTGATSAGQILLYSSSGTRSGIRATVIASSFSDIDTGTSFVEYNTTGSAKPYAISANGILDGAMFTVSGVVGDSNVFNSPALNPTQAGYTSGYPATRNFATNPDDWIENSHGGGTGCISSTMAYTSSPLTLTSSYSFVDNFSGAFYGSILSRTFVMRSHTMTMASTGVNRAKLTTSLTANLYKAMFGSTSLTTTTSVYPLTDIHSTVALQSSVAGTINLNQNMNATIFSAYALQGSMTQQHALSSTIAATFTVSGRFQQKIFMEGTIASLFTLSSAATIPTNSNLDLLDSINADMGLETPQIVLDWKYKEEIPDVSRVLIRKSKNRFPKDEADGDLVSQEYLTSQSLRTTFADTDVEADKTYYYSIFFDHKSPFSMDRDYERDVERLGTVYSTVGGFYYAFEEVISTNDDNPIAGTLDHGHVKPYSVEVKYTSSDVEYTAKDDGQGGFLAPHSGAIDYITGEYSITLDDNPDTDTETTITYNYGIESFWILARDNSNNITLWLYNTHKKLATEKVVIDAVLQSGEAVNAVADFQASGTSAAPTYVFDIVTNLRFIQIEVPVGVIDVNSDHILSQWSLTSRLPVGYEVNGATVDRLTAGGAKGVRIVDRYNKEARLFSMNGTLSRTMDLSGLEGMIGVFNGIAYDPDNHRILIGNDKTIYGIASSNNSPTTSTILSLHPVRQIITADFALASDKIIAVDKTFDLLEVYVYSDKSTAYVQMEEPYVPAGFIKSIFHFDEEEGDDLIDSSGTDLPPVFVGNVQQGVKGKFGSAVQLTLPTQAVDMTDAAVNFSRNTGFILFWYKSPYVGYLPPPSGDSILFKLDVNGTDGMRLTLKANGNITLTQTRAGTTYTATASNSQEVLDDERFHCFAILWTNAGSLDLAIDGEVKATVAIPSSVMNAAVPAYMGLGDGTASALGSYDEFVMSNSRKTINFRYDITTVGNRCWSNSGRDYSTSTLFSFRNQFRKYFSDYVLKKDYGQEALAPNTQLPSGEVLFREERDQMVLGELGRTTRFYGLLIDRIVDKRDSLQRNLNPMDVEYEYLDDLGTLINAAEFDDEWNVDQMRRYLEVIFNARQKAGSLDAFESMARFLGFTLYLPNGTIPFITSRLKYDSCDAALRPDTPFDTGIFDSRQASYPLVRLLVTIFQRVIYSRKGNVNGLVLTDPEALFLTTAEEGSLIEVYDYANPGSNGQYLIRNVLSNTQVEVDQFFPETLSNVAYTLSWQVPPVDPYVQQLFYRFKKVKVRWQQFDYDKVTEIDDPSSGDDDMAARSDEFELEHKVETEVVSPLGLVPDDIWVSGSGYYPDTAPSITWKVVDNSVFVTAEYPPGDHCLKLEIDDPLVFDNGVEDEALFATTVVEDADDAALTVSGNRIAATIDGRYRFDVNLKPTDSDPMYSRKVVLKKNGSTVLAETSGVAAFLSVEIDLVGEDMVSVYVTCDGPTGETTEISVGWFQGRRVSVAEGHSDTVRLTFFKNPE